MTIARAYDLQAAVYVRLAAALAGQGVGGVDVPVHDHPHRDPPRLFCRIDGFATIDASPKNAAIADHVFTVHLFDRAEGASSGRGQKEVKRLMALADAQLNRWAPFAGEPALRLAASSVDRDEDGVTQHGWLRYTITIGE